MGSAEEIAHAKINEIDIDILQYYTSVNNHTDRRFSNPLNALMATILGRELHIG